MNTFRYWRWVFKNICLTIMKFYVVYFSCATKFMSKGHQYLWTILISCLPPARNPRWRPKIDENHRSLNQKLRTKALINFHIELTSSFFHNMGKLVGKFGPNAFRSIHDSICLVWNPMLTQYFQPQTKQLLLKPFYFWLQIRSLPMFWSY